MSYQRRLSATLLAADGVTPVLDANSDPVLQNAWAIEFYDELNGPGSGSCVLALSEPGVGEVVPGRFVRISDDQSTVLFTFMIEGNPEVQSKKRGEEFEEVINISGRGWACYLDQAIVYPSANMNLPFDNSWRLFSFASPDFPNDGAWGPAIEQHEYMDGVATASCYSHFQMGADADPQPYPAPIGFPFNTSPAVIVKTETSPGVFEWVKGDDYVDTYWIRPFDADFRETGYFFFRYTWELEEQMTVVFTPTWDNLGVFFIEGVPVLGEQDDEWMWTGWKEVTLQLPAGTYTLAAYVQNLPHYDPINYPACDADEAYDDGEPGGLTTGNPGGFLFVAFEASAGNPKNAVVVTSSDWMSKFDPSVFPGWTPGQIMDALLDEAQSRGSIAAFDSYTFSTTQDSDGNSWADAPGASSIYIPSFSVEVGSTVMAALIQLHEEGWIDWRVHPDQLVLDAWVVGKLGDSSSPVAAYTVGTNLVELQRGQTDLYANALLVQYEGGYREVEDASEISSFGTRVEDIYATNATTYDDAGRQGEIELDRRISSAWPALAVTIEPTSSTDCPYYGVQIGDYVTVPAHGGGTMSAQVLAIKAETDEDGYAIWHYELNRRWLNPSRKTNDLLRDIGGISRKLKGRVN